MTGATHDELCDALLRPDGQEDLRLVTYALSTGSRRRTALLREVIEPLDGDRHVHGNASVTSTYVLRTATHAAETGLGVAIAHSHPGASGWQAMSGPDRDAESSYGNLAREITGLPLIGLTLAGGDQQWSARHWDAGTGTGIDASHCVNVRVIAAQLNVSWNDYLAPVPAEDRRLRRTTSAWGPRVQADLARRSVLIVGLGSVGFDVAVRLAASGCTDIGLMDFDTVDWVNLDRLIGATRRDAKLGRRKIDVAHELVAAQATHPTVTIKTHSESICEPEGFKIALDYDLVFSCVDRPWPRAVLNALAYTDFIPVVDGGIAIDAFSDGGIRNATWRSHVIGPGRPCLTCIGQLDPSHVPLDIEGLLDDAVYIAGTGITEPGAPNVATLSISVAAALLSQYVSLNAAPGGLGDPGPLRYLLSTHSLEHLQMDSAPHCATEAQLGAGNERFNLTGGHPAAEERRSQTRQRSDTTRSATDPQPFIAAAFRAIRRRWTHR